MNLFKHLVGVQWERDCKLIIVQVRICGRPKTFGWCEKKLSKALSVKLDKKRELYEKFVLQTVVVDQTFEN